MSWYEHNWTASVVAKPSHLFQMLFIDDNLVVDSCEDEADDLTEPSQCTMRVVRHDCIETFNSLGFNFPIDFVLTNFDLQSSLIKL